MQSLLAETTITLPLTSPIFWLGITAMGIPALIATVNGFMEIVARFKRMPPDHEVYATKKELKETETRLHSMITADGGDLDEVEDRLTKTRTEMEGRINERFDKIEDTQATMHSSNQAELKSIASQMGRVFGFLEGLAPKKSH